MAVEQYTLSVFFDIRGAFDNIFIICETGTEWAEIYIRRT